jgi:hypothetical protein
MAAAPVGMDRNERKPAPRSHAGTVVAMAALAVAAAAWFWALRQPMQPDGSIGPSHGVMVVGAGAFVVALIVYIRAMSFWDILEALWEMILGLFRLIGAMLKGLWNGLCALLGW